jgi:DNA polymerase III subunit beta
MKLICTQDNFKKAILNTERVVSKQNTLPILNNILFEATKNNLKLSATNLEIGIINKIGAKIEKEGKITIPGRIIGNFVNNLPKGENIKIETQDQNLKITSGSYKAVIKGLLADDFPLIPQKNSAFLLFLNPLELKEAINKVITCVSFNEARQELTGINLILGKKELFLAATDSFRLAEAKINLGEDSINKEIYNIFIEKRNNLIIPASTMLELSRIIALGLEDKIKIAVDEGQIFFEIGETRLVSRLINGKYPEYKHIMPENYKTRVVLEKSLLQSMLKMASVFTSGKSSDVTLKIDADASKLLIDVKSAEAGENSSEVKLDTHGPSQEVIFNSKYLLDGVNTIETSQVAILLNSDATPVALKEINEKNGEVLDKYVYIAMPIKN